MIKATLAQTDGCLKRQEVGSMEVVARPLWRPRLGTGALLVGVMLCSASLLAVLGQFVGAHVNGGKQQGDFASVEQFFASARNW